ncbi:hypothetical protein ACMDCR_24875 [Labrys okinawensis]|uniref:hypothetical protein n=1 Tax=Labrys okinawensis TaxID=346911 RepID=UPI0039BD6D0C
MRESAKNGSSGVLDVAKELGLFRVADVAELTGLSARAVEKILRDNKSLVEPVPGDDGIWRLAPESLHSTSDRTDADPKVAQDFIATAGASVKALERGMVQEAALRKSMLSAAEQRMKLARRSIQQGESSELHEQLADAERRVAKLRDYSFRAPDPLLSQLQDWTVKLEGSFSENPSALFDLDASLRTAIESAGDPSAVFWPARAALAAQRRHPTNQDLAPTLDHEIRKAALDGDVFKVLALACIAAVSKLATTSDALMGAITTRTFRSNADRTARRVAYTALASLACPGIAENQRAVEACDYQIRRESPGCDEMELLAPAALQSRRTDPVAAIALIARYLKWESSRDHRGLQDRKSLPRLGHVARNIACSLDNCGYQQLERALAPLAEDELGVLLIHHLSDYQNHAIELRPRPPQLQSDRSQGGYDYEDDVLEGVRQFGALARSRVAKITNPEGKREYTYLWIKPRTRVAEAIAMIVTNQPPELPRREFTRLRRKWAHYNA